MKFVIDRYEVQWYAAPIEIQKLLLFMMIKTTKTYGLNVANMLTASIETFAMVENIPIL